MRLDGGFRLHGLRWNNNIIKVSHAYINIYKTNPTEKNKPCNGRKQNLLCSVNVNWRLFLWCTVFANKQFSGKLTVQK